MNKSIIRISVMLLALAFALTGCNLIETNQLALIEDDRAEIEKEMATVVAEYDGGTVTEFDAMMPFNQTYSMYYQFYSQYNMSLGAEDIADLQKRTVENEVQSRALSAEFEKRGLELEETEEELRAEADDVWQSYYDSYYSSAEGSTDEEKQARTELQLYALGMTKDRMFELEQYEHRQQALEEDIKAEITEITDEDLKAVYDDKVAADEEKYTANPGSFGDNKTNGNAVYWVPEGYRTVKHILIAPEEDVLTAMNDAREAVKTAQGDLEALETELEGAQAATEAPEAEDAAEGEEAEAEETAEEPAAEDEAEMARGAEEIQADIDAKKSEIESLEQARFDAESAVLESIQDTLDEIYGKLTAGESFDDVMAEYGTDPGMQSEPGMTEGYYICEASTNMVSEFVEGSMALEKVGDYSETPVLSEFGAHIIYYNADVTPGTIALEDVHDALYDETLENRKNDHYNETVEALVEAINPVYHLDAWQIG